MKFLLMLFLVSFTSVASAQNHTNPGGGVPDDDEKESKECLSQAETVTGKEKAFVEGFKLTYNSESDFASLLEKINIDSSLRTLNNPKQLGQANFECSEGNIEALKSILDLYKAASSQQFICKSFRERVKQIDRIEKIIESHAKK